MYMYIAIPYHVLALSFNVLYAGDQTLHLPFSVAHSHLYVNTKYLKMRLSVLSDMSY